jgi:hypothetical protein
MQKIDNTARLISARQHECKEAIKLIQQEIDTQYGAVLSYFTDQWTNDLVHIKNAEMLIGGGRDSRI